MNLPSLGAELIRLKAQTEARWAEAELDPAVYGYQVQRGTRWNPGLSPEQIDAYQWALGVRFPGSFRCMLSVMNGTDLPETNLFGSSGIAPEEWVGVYAWPRDLQAVRERVALVQEAREEIAGVLADQGFRLAPDAGLVPIYAHRYLVCGGDPLDGPVLSIHGTDAIVYGPDLLSYLRKELLDGIEGDG